MPHCRRLPPSGASPDLDLHHVDAHRAGSRLREQSPTRNEPLDLQSLTSEISRITAAMDAQPQTPSEPSQTTTPITAEERAQLTARGARTLSLLNANIAAGKILSFQEYNTKSPAYYASCSAAPLPLPVDSGLAFDETTMFLATHGIHSGITATTVEIWAAKEETVKAADGTINFNSVWKGCASADAAILLREREFRQSGLRGEDCEVMYPGIPEEDRIHMSDHIAAVWKLFGAGRPLQKVGVVDVMNPTTESLLEEVYLTRRPSRNFDGVTVTETDPEWMPILGSSVVHPLLRALADHPSLFHNYRPKSVSVMVEYGVIETFTVVIDLGP